MDIQKLQNIYAKHPGVKALADALGTTRKTIQLSGLQGSSAAMVFAALPSLMGGYGGRAFLFILDDEEEAGYFYHDLTQILGPEQVLFFPSSYKRAIKYGQRDAGNEILRTEVLTKLSPPSLSPRGEAKDYSPSGEIVGGQALYIVTHPQALAELVVTKKQLNEQTLTLHTGEQVDIMFVQETLMTFGFKRVDYVYEPGQLAVRGSIIDVYSYSCEYPYRIDFFGDVVDSIRTFEVQSQLSKTKLQNISIVPEMTTLQEGRESFLSFLPKDTVLVMKDPAFVYESISLICEEGFSKQAIAEQEAASITMAAEHVLVNPAEFKQQLLDFRHIELRSASLTSQLSTFNSQLNFSTHPQPVFHKNFDLLFQSFQQYIEDGYQIYILADSQKQTARLESIFQEQQTKISFIPISKTIHAGFVDDDLKTCFFTDHQIFDRYHKYNLRSEQTRNGKVTLTLKELQQFEIGDYVVHLDHGVGKFGGLVRIPNGDRMQEVIKIIYHSLSQHPLSHTRII